MYKINVAVKCEEIWQLCAVQAICEGSWKHVTANASLHKYPIVFADSSGTVCNWSWQKPIVPVISFDEFILKYGERMHKVKGKWRPEFE